MTNDTNTITGALQEIIDRLENNLQNKGVNATYDSTTGILGLVDRISEISQSSGSSGVPCYHVEFTDRSLNYGDWDFTQNIQIADLEVYLQYQYEPYQGTVTITDGTNTYNVTTGQDGYGTLKAPITANSTIFTATYTNTTDTITVTKSTFLFKDSCTSSSGLENYDSYVQLYTSSSGNPSCEMVYDETKGYYKIYATNTGTSYYSMLPIPDLDGETDYVASMEIQQTKSYSSNETGFYVDNSEDETSYGYGGTLCVYYNRLYGKRFIKTSVSTANNLTLEGHTMVINTWYRLELEVNDTKHHVRLYDENNNLLGEVSYTQSISNKQLGILQKGGSVANTTNYIRNIKVREL